MPNRHYIPSGGRWPGWLDHLFAHLNEFGLAVISTLVGTNILVGAIYPPYYASVILRNFQPHHEMLISVPLVLGGVLVGWSTLASFEKRTTYWLWLRVGLLLEALGWFGYLAAVLLTYDEMSISGMFSFGLGAILTFRFTRTFIDERRIRNLGKDSADFVWEDFH